MARSKPVANWKAWLEDMKSAAPPSRIDHPFRVIAEQAEVAEHDGRKLRVRSYDLRLPYLNVMGRPAAARVRLTMPPKAQAPLPIVLNVHYPAPLPAGADFLAEGWAVMTPLECPSVVLDSVNLNLAMIQAARAMPFVDGRRMAITGGSAGGFMTLMTAATLFPIVAAVPHAPVVNWAYGSLYVRKNLRVARCGKKDRQGNDASLVPLVCAVAGIADDTWRPLGDPDRGAAANWIACSPVGIMDRITCPVHAWFSTADVLVTINQVDADLAYPMPESFPKGFTFDMDAVLKEPAGRITLRQALRGRRVKFLDFPIPAGLNPFWEILGQATPPRPRRLALPFAKDADFSIVIIDEGPPDPRIGHMKYHFVAPGVGFMKHWMAKVRPLREEQLTAVKLETLMRRFRGENFEGVRDHRSDGGRGAVINRRNRPGKECLDVILGLRAYCEIGPAHAARLARLYARLAPDLRALDGQRGAVVARFKDDTIGGLMFHEAVLHRRWGDKVKAARLVRQLQRTPAHAAYAACLPPRLTERSTASARR